MIDLNLQDFCAVPDLIQRAQEDLRGASADACCLCRATVNCGPFAIRLKQPVNGKCCLCGPDFPCTGNGFKLKPFAVGRTPEECCTKDCLEVGDTQVCKQPELCQGSICTEGGYDMRTKIKLHYVNEPAQLVDPFGTNPSTCCSCALEVNCGWPGAERLEIPVKIEGGYTCCRCGNFLCDREKVRSPRTMPALTFSECCQESPERRKLDTKVVNRKRRRLSNWIIESNCSSVFTTPDNMEDFYKERCTGGRVLRLNQSVQCVDTWPSNCTYEKALSYNLNNEDLQAHPCCISWNQDTCCAGKWCMQAAYLYACLRMCLAQLQKHVK